MWLSSGVCMYNTRVPWQEQAHVRFTLHHAKILLVSRFVTTTPFGPPLECFYTFFTGVGSVLAYFLGARPVRQNRQEFLSMTIFFRAKFNIY